ncbi:MAG: hypothetical protein J6X61_02265 [Clostridia bacterium]|nr:hypothetical protein [Clostridia bacterium]
MKRWVRPLSVLLAAALVLTCLGACSSNNARVRDDKDDYTIDLDDLKDLYDDEEPEDEESEEEEPEEEEPEESEEQKGGLRSDFKAAMDSYEAFMDEYVTFMKKYKANPTDISVISSYSSYVSKYADFVSKFSKWESEDLNDEEMQYYLAVQSRVSKKLLDAGING